MEAVDSEIEEEAAEVAIPPPVSEAEWKQAAVELVKSFKKKHEVDKYEGEDFANLFINGFFNSVTHKEIDAVAKKNKIVIDKESNRQVKLQKILTFIVGN